MAKDIWCVDNPVDRAAITATGAVAGLTPDRIADPRRGKAWRPGAPTDTLKITFANAVQVDVILVAGPAFKPDTELTLELSSTPGAGDLRTGPWLPKIDRMARQALWIADVDAPGGTGLTVREIVLSASGLDIGRVWAGPALWRPHFTHVYGAQQFVEDLSQKQVALRSGTVFTDTAARLRRQEIKYEAMPVFEWDGPARDLSLTAGLAKQVLFVPDHEYYPPERHAILGYQETLNPIQALGFRRFEQTFVLRESG
ncbi:MAG: hypothetical protein ACE37J_12290 [Pikeienuella sp.]|uniref:hypothetical protein n=1 Tax=Pikeienuella sp. TaxID=2831957 RepID=UPI00391D60CA